ncbi:MAG: VTT domain-containing protein [Hyphomicrobiaceae bacterium]|nr:VTT domain-containing protein [Hyphomicrobiaceae bacterium]
MSPADPEAHLRRTPPSASGAHPPEAGPRSALATWAPVLVLAALAALVVAMGWHRYLSFATIGQNYGMLAAYVSANFAMAIGAYMLAYIAVVALSLPGGLVMTLTGGLLFGLIAGALATAIAATIGATIVFLIARSSLGQAMAARAGPWLSRLAAGFREDAFAYLLFLRLVPAFPFFVVNIVPALLGVRLSTYVTATLIGILPGTIAFTLAGTGLGSVIEAQNALQQTCLAEHAGHLAACPYTIDTSALVTPELLLAFAALGVVALIPVIARKWSKSHAAA